MKKPRSVQCRHRRSDAGPRCENIATALNSRASVSSRWSGSRCHRRTPCCEHSPLYIAPANILSGQDQLVCLADCECQAPLPPHLVSHPSPPEPVRPSRATSTRYRNNGSPNDTPTTSVPETGSHGLANLLSTPSVNINRNKTIAETTTSNQPNVAILELVICSKRRETSRPYSEIQRRN